MLTTRCPDCRTLYRVEEAVLAESQGLARCCKCDSVFDAYVRMERPARQPAPKRPRPNGPPATGKLDAPAALNDNITSSLLADPEQLERLPVDNPGSLDEDELEELLSELPDDDVIAASVPAPAFDADPSPENLAFGFEESDPPAAQRDRKVEPRPAKPARAKPDKPDKPAATEPARDDLDLGGLDDLFGRLETDSGLTKGTDEAVVDEDTQPSLFDLPSEMPEIQPAKPAADESHPLLQEASSPRRLPPGLGWVLGLGLLALAQLVWFQRAALIDSPLGRMVAEPVCELAGCELKPRRDLASFRILQREFSPDSRYPNAYRMQLAFANAAEFAQPYPDLQLSVSDYNDQEIARRRLEPRDYLDPPPGAAALIASRQTVVVDLVFDEPGQVAVGFVIDFL